MELSNVLNNLEVHKEPLSLPEMLRAFWRRFGLFAATVLLVSTLAILISLRAQPQYTATANVMIDAKSGSLIDLESVFMGAGPDAGKIDTEVEVIRSRSLADKVIRKLELVNDAEYNVKLADASSSNKFKSSIQALFPTSILETTSVEPSEQDEFDAVVSSVLEDLKVMRNGNTYVLNVRFTSANPQKSARVANAFADQYLLEQLETKFETTSRANDWLIERLEGLREEVRQSEGAVEDYRARSGLLSAQGSSLTEQQITDLNGQLIAQTSAYNEVRARLDSVKAQIVRGTSVDSIAEVMASNVIRDLRAQESAVAVRKSELSSRYGPRHPDVLKVDREAVDIQAQIQQEINRIVSSLESEVGIARQKVSTIESGLSGLRTELSSNNRSLVRLRELEREAEASRTLYQSFLERFQQIDDQEDIAQAEARVISRAVVPTKQSSPNTLFNILFGIILGILAGLGMVVLAEILDNGLTTGADVEREINVPFISSVPELNPGLLGLGARLLNSAKKPEQHLIDQPFSMFAESFRNIRSSILLSSVERTSQVVAIASALPNEGKTTVVRSIGHVSALSGTKTVIIDCDLRLRQLSTGANQKPKSGLVKHLRGDAPLKDVIITDDDSGCDFIFCRNDEYSNKDLFGTPKFENMLKSLRKKYDLIILDTAPVLMVADTRSIVKQADSVVIATRWRKTKADAVQKAAAILRKIDTNILGVVLTRVNFKKRAKYGAGDYSYYAGKYGSYYTPTDGEFPRS